MSRRRSWREEKERVEVEILQSRQKEKQAILVWNKRRFLEGVQSETWISTLNGRLKHQARQSPGFVQRFVPPCA
jgi:hypothetical protein